MILAVEVNADLIEWIRLRFCRRAYLYGFAVFLAYVFDIFLNTLADHEPYELEGEEDRNQDLDIKDIRRIVEIVLELLVQIVHQAGGCNREISNNQLHINYGK